MGADEHIRVIFHGNTPSRGTLCPFLYGLGLLAFLRSFEAGSEDVCQAVKEFRTILQKPGNQMPMKLYVPIQQLCFALVRQEDIHPSTFQSRYESERGGS